MTSAITTTQEDLGRQPMTFDADLDFCQALAESRRIVSDGENDRACAGLLPGN